VVGKGSDFSASVRWPNVFPCGLLAGQALVVEGCCIVVVDVGTFFCAYYFFSGGMFCPKIAPFLNLFFSFLNSFLNVL
jgi:hypothetical protein